MSHQKALPFFLLLGVATLSAQAQAFESLPPSDVEVTVDNIVYIDRTISGEMVGMEEVTVRFLKLANGQLLYERSRQAPAALEFNERSCAMVDRPVFDSHRSLIVSGNSAVPLDCGMNDEDYERWERNFGRPHPDRSEKENGEKTAA